MKTLGKYEVIEEINSGGMGQIFRARDRVLRREVAIKTIYTGLTEPEIKNRFYREARSCAALNHPNIVTVFDLGEQQGSSFIAMELLDGEDLRKFIDRRGAMSLEAKIACMIDICDGLANAHEHGIVHRDIKPGNIFITRSGKPKILDFGVAHIAASNLTQPGVAPGTPRYMAPEQYLGMDCNALSDIFSVGMVFFEFLTYCHPFAIEPDSQLNSRDIPSRIVKDEPSLLRALDPAMPERLEKVIAKTMAKDPAARHQSSKELAKEMRKVAFDLARECSLLWNEMLDCRKRIIDYKSALGKTMESPKAQFTLKQANLDPLIADEINPDSSATAISDLYYLDLVARNGELKRLEGILAKMAEESQNTGLRKILKALRI
jgi:eukaryotic-like serine/threonine-protein kinase